MKRILPILIITALLSGVVWNGCSAPHKVPLTSGHRGANAIAPENTMASIDSCIKYGIGNIECDVCISKDSVFYLLHDSMLNRTTNGTGNIREWLSADIDTLDAGSWFAPKFAGVRVPRFTDVLRKAKLNGAKLVVDFNNGSLEKLLELIKQEGMLENCNFSFYEKETAKQFRKIAPDVKTLQAYVKNPAELNSVITELNPNIVVTHIDSITPEFVQECHRRNLLVTALALGLEDKATENQKAVDLGVDIIATDRPEQFVLKYGN